MQSFKAETPGNKFDIEYYHGFIRKEEVSLRKDFFSSMCKSGCINYGRKYSCPPFAPSFDSLINEKQGIYIVLFKLNLNQINSTEYNKIRIANSVLKSRIIRIMRFLEQEFNTVFLSTGSCSLCKSCSLKSNLSCKYPDKRRYSLEAVGVDCNNLCEKLFNMKLLWYKNKKAPEYACVVCGLVCNEAEANAVNKELNRKIQNINYDNKS